MLKFKVIFMLLFAMIVLAGCGTMSKAFTTSVSSLPSMQHCQKVSYLRDNGEITINANCHLPPPDPGGLDLTSMI